MKTTQLQAKVKIIDKVKHYYCEQCGHFKKDTELKCDFNEDKRIWKCKECQELEIYNIENIPVNYIDHPTFVMGHGENLKKRLFICGICEEGKENTELIYIDGSHKLICRDCQKKI
jgi:rubrerythrin